MFDFQYDGPGFGKGGTGVLTVDDVGVDTRTGVDDNDYQVPFRFTGKLDKLTVKLVPMKAAEEKLLREKAQDARNKAQ